MTTIQKDNNRLRLINVFHVKPENQQALVDLLIEATENTMQYLPGFVSANIHKSHDGKRVVNYGYLRSIEDFEAMQQREEVKPHMQKAAELAESYDPILCDLVFVHEV